MAIPRGRVVDEAISGFYHCISRCVRRCHLLEADDDHRREWLVAQIRLLCTAFAMDVVALAIMQNHMHVLVRTLPELVRCWSDREVAFRWLLVRPNRTLRRKLGIDPDAPPQPVEIDRLCMNSSRIMVLRSRLSSLSWFMKELKEPIARRANSEEGVTGRFWQDRFKSYRVLDEAALLCCMSYIDLNPVTAGLAENPLLATRTSVDEHLRGLWQDVSRSPDPRAKRPDTPEEIEAFVGLFDEAAFVPAVAAKRDAHLGVEAADGGSLAAERPRPQDEIDASPTSRTPRHARRTPAPAPAPAPASTHPLPDEVEDLARGLPPLRILGISLGDYFRRLVELGRHAFEKARLRRAARAGVAAVGVQRCPAIDPRLILDGMAAPLAVVAATLDRLRFRGTVIGSGASVAAEALRRHAPRVMQALRLATADG